MSTRIFTHTITLASILLLSTTLLYFSWTLWHSFFVGVIALVLYYTMNAYTWGSLLKKVIPFSNTWAYLFGFLTIFYISAFSMGIPVVVWKYQRFTIALILIVIGLIGLFLSRKERQTKNSSIFLSEKVSQLKTFFVDALKDKLVIAFGVLGALFVFFIFHARTGVYILSPWDALSSFVLILFFALTFIVARMVFSKRSIGLVLAVIILFSYASHLHITGIYETGFGGDKWRHLGAEKWLQEGNIYTPSIWGEERSIIHFGPLGVPESLVAGNKTSYAAQWSTTIFLSESLGVSLFLVDLLLVFLLWSLFLPLILYQFGVLLSSTQKNEIDNRLGLLFAFLPILFYTFQSEGAITIPVSFGHLFFFFVFFIWMYYVQTGKKSARLVATLLSLFFYWGYILNFFVLIGTGVLSVVYRKLFIEKSHWVRYKEKLGLSDARIRVRDYTIFGALLCVSVFALPFLEVFQGLSGYLPGSLSAKGILDSFANAFGQMSGFIGIVVPPDFIDQGNFLYNQTKESLSRLPLFSYRAVPFVVSMLVWGVITSELYRMFKNRSQYKTFILIALLFIITITTFFISWSFTEGVHILARRLNETIAFLMVLLLGSGLWFFLHNKKIHIPYKKKILLVSFGLAFAATSTYASGPKLQLVTADELKAAQVVWAEHQQDETPYCVLANTWPLLGLEAVSGRKITAGNFPVYHEYAQPERVKLFEGMSKKPSQEFIDGAFAVTNASVCYYMTENRWINDRVLDATIEMLGESRRVGTVYIWRIEQ